MAWETPEGYRLGKLLRSTAHSTIYEAAREPDGKAVLLKTYQADGSRTGGARAQREFDMLVLAAQDGVPAALDLDTTTGKAVLVLERVPGLPLSRSLRDGWLDTETWLTIAVQAAEILAGVHARRILHKDLTPENILFDEQQQRVWICDFGVAVELGAATSKRELLGPTVAAMLHYISPEQTGRMNRGCDFRSDLYTLGATLYHLLTGRPPFDLEDPLELVHAHLARTPDAPIDVRPETPPILSELLLKLLRKEPQERYQSARALCDDLVTCSRSLRGDPHALDRFSLGTSEIPDAPEFEPRLYGRDRESARLHRLLRETADGESRVLWIEGPPGAGKSSLVDQLRPRLAEACGYMIVGKFDHYSERPYSAWIAAISGLVHQLLIESDERLQGWRSELQRGLGPIAGAVVELVPDLGFILDEVPPLVRLDSREAQARLALALRRLILACASPEHPLAIFLDDLQWSDPASLELLQQILIDPPRAMLLVGAVRELPASDRVRTLLESSCDSGVAEWMQLPPLTREATTQMLADALRPDLSETSALAEFVECRTGNVPSLVRDLVEHLHARGLIRHEQESGWTWNMDELARVELPDSAVELMSRKLELLPSEARAILEFASCVGNEFDADLLGKLGQRDRGDIYDGLCRLADAGLILPSANGFRFAHDQIRECAQKQLSAEERYALHCSTARLLLGATDESVLAERAPEIVSHLNHVPELPDDLKSMSIRLNFMTGARSLAVGAAASAADHFGVCLELLRTADPEICQQLGLEVHIQGAESAFQLAEFERALSLLDAIGSADLSVIDRARVASKRVQVYALCKTPEECVEHTLEAMRGLGVRWPIHPSRLRAQIALWLVRLRIRKHTKPELLAPATAFPLPLIAQLVVLRPSAAALARVDVHLAVLATCLSMRRHLQYGYVTPPAFPISVYAIYVYLFLGDRKCAEKLAAVALDWADRLADPAGPRARMMVEVMLHPFLMPRRRAFSGIDRIVEDARENGDIEFSNYSRYHWIVYLALAGDSVRESQRRITELASQIQNSPLWSTELARCERVFTHLASPETKVETLERDYQAVVDAYGAINSGDGSSGMLWLMLLCVYGRYQLAFEHAELLRVDLFRSAPFLQVVDHAFYHGLSSAVLAGAARRGSRRHYCKILRQSLTYLRRRARDGPDFVHLEMLLEAERRRLSRDIQRARQLYETAALRAKEQHFPNHAGLAYERLANMLAELRRETDAGGILQKAIASYKEWGATGKVRQLQARGSSSARAGSARS